MQQPGAALPSGFRHSLIKEQKVDERSHGEPTEVAVLAKWGSNETRTYNGKANQIR